MTNNSSGFLKGGGGSNPFLEYKFMIIADIHFVEDLIFYKIEQIFLAAE